MSCCAALDAVHLMGLSATIIITTALEITVVVVDAIIVVILVVLATFIVIFRAHFLTIIEEIFIADIAFLINL